MPIPATPVCLLSSPDRGLPPSLELAATLYLPGEPAQEPLREPAPGLVVGHGAGSRGSRHADFCLDACRQGFAVLALDFRGHGNSSGIGDGPLEQDVLAAVRFLREHPAVDPAFVCYRGSSLGGFYGLKAASEARFTAMALLCPAGEAMLLDALNEDTNEAPLADDARWDRSHLRSYFERQDSRVLASRVGCPVLLVHARPDERVPFAHSLLLAEHLRTDTTLLALENGSHTSAQHDPAIHAHTIAWMTAIVMKARSRRC